MTAIQAAVVSWYRREQRDLPWRRADVTPWQILVSEIMLQQTPAARVAPAFADWIARWPDAATLADAATADVLRQWGRLGYPNRALRLQAAARVVRDEHGGELPRDYDGLIALPGVGDYTASAIIAFAFGERSVVLDTNVRRVISRVWHGVERPYPTVTRAERAFAESLVPREGARAAAWSAAVMELGAVICTMRSPRCQECVIRRDCAWQAAGAPTSTVTRRSQQFEGTDRQARGVVMACLRDTVGSVSRSDLEAQWHDSAQLQRALNGLVEDGLAEQTRAGRYRLPK